MTSLRKRIGLWAVLCVFLSLVLLGSAREARAQTAAYYSGVVSELPRSTYGSDAMGAAVDASGDVFAVNADNIGTVTETVAVNGQVSSSSQVKEVNFAFMMELTSVAADSHGDLFVTDVHSNSVDEIVSANGQFSSSSTLKTVASGFKAPRGVAVDAAGDVFVADTGNNAVKEIVAVNGQVSTSSQVKTVGSGFYLPEGVAVDASGNVFVGDYGHGLVKEIVAVNGQVSSSSQVKTVGSGFDLPEGVAVDSSGDVFVADKGNSAVKEIVAVNGQVSSSSQVNTVGSGFSTPEGVALGAGGDIFVADSESIEMFEIQFGAVNFGSVNVGSTSSTVLVPFNFATISRVSGWSVLTQGATGKDFTEVAGSTTCSNQDYIYGSGNTCSVAVQFSPLHPGLRMGAVQLLDGIGDVVGTAQLKGIGIGPQVVFPSNSGSKILGSSFSGPRGVAVDGSGDVFVVDTGNNAVKEIVAVNGQVSSSSTVNTVNTGFNAPEGVAVDASGDVFVADPFINAVYEIVAVNGQVSPSSTVKTVGSSFSGPRGVAVDGSGDVFVADSGNNAVKEIVAVNGQVSSSSPIKTVGSGFSGPTGVAVDASGDVFVADFGNSAVKEIPASCIRGANNSTCVTTLGGGFDRPIGVAVDASGDVFVADSSNNAVYEIVAVNGQVSSSSTVNTVNTGFINPQGVAVDASGDVFVADLGNNPVMELPLATAPSHTFPTVTAVGTTDATDGPFSFPVANDGNATLTFPIPVTGDNPSVSADFAYDNASTCLQSDASTQTAFTLNPGPSCTVAVDFSPTAAGSIAGSAVLIDDSLNASPTATQTVYLKGTSELIALSPSTLPPGVAGTAYSQTITASGGTSPYTFTLSSGSLPTGITLNSGQISGTPTEGGTSNFSIQVTDNLGATFTQSFTLFILAPDVDLSPGGLPAGTYGSSYSQPLSASGGTGPYTFAVTGGALPGGLSLSAGGVLSGTATAAGTFSFTITATDSSTGSGPYSSSQAYTLSISPVSLTVTADSVTRVYGAANPAFTGTVTGAVNGDSFTEAFSTTATTTSNAGTYAIVPSVTGANLSNYTVAKQNGTLTVTQAALTVTADNATRVYGTSNPAFTGKVTGAQTGDTFTESFSTAATTTSNAGAYAIVPSVSGANLSDYTVTTQNGMLTVTQAATTTTLSVSDTSVNPSQSVTLTATVADATAGSTGAPTGIVSFYDGSSLLGAQMLTGGAATLPTTALNAGATNAITAVYGGDTDFAGSSTTASTGIVVAPLDFTFTAATSTWTSISAGGTATFSFALTPRYGSYPAAVSFAAAHLPSGATATFSPATVAANGGQQTITMTVKTSAQSAMAQPASSIGRRLAPLSLAFLLLPFFGLGRTRRRLSRLLCVLLLVGGLAAAVSISGCGGSSSISGHDYPITVTATSGATQHQALVFLATK